ncbi:MAG: NPCBM/NEW2 domain-containing protein [Bacteroidales bacterium]|jgi:alpha-galactosidase|nr:NPCBM/NEW2 domain-containing protein [Bacteroidales bacterium]
MKLNIRLFILLFVAGWAVGCSHPSLVVEITELDLSAFAVGWGETKANLSISGTPLSIAGTPYEKGFGTHATGEAHIRLDGRQGTFTALAGVDDNADSHASVVFYVFTNKGTAFNSGVMKKGDAPKPVEVALKGVTDLYLLVDPTSDGNHSDHADWVNAQFTVFSAPVAIKDDHSEERYILTPPPAPQPRVNGAKITGASPAKPFLFTIAATGNRPMTFAAANLPAGLSLNEATGVISGVCSREGKYIVPLTVSNSLGECHDTLEIHIGGGLALTPHIGWNSWYIYATGVTQDIMEQSAQAMYDKGLVNFGYAYVNIDDGWEIKVGSNDLVIGGAVRNPDGTIRTNKNFPDMKAMTDYIHRLGLKAGLYSSPGRSTCGGYAGSFEHEAQDIQSYVDWGFDFLKYDWCSYGQEVPVHDLENMQKPYLLISKLIKEAPRDIILNMCQYGMGDVWKWGKEVGGNSWRTTGDLGASTQELSASMFSIGFFQEQIREYSGPDGWNDPDYLLFGNIYDWANQKAVLSPLSPSEHYTCMTLWSMMSAPLIFSGEITTLDDFTKNILCNAEVIDIDQDKLGKAGYCIQNRDLIEIWKKELHDGNTAIAVFNKRPFGSVVEVDWKALGYDGKFFARDLWRQTDLGDIRKVASFDIPRHGCVMLKVTKR